MNFLSCLTTISQWLFPSSENISSQTPQLLDITKPENHFPIYSLPREIQHTIGTYLSWKANYTVARICTATRFFAWNTLLHDKEKLQGVIQNLINREKIDVIFKCVPKGCAQQITLKLKYSTLSSAQFVELFDRFPCLHSLDVNNCEQIPFEKIDKKNLGRLRVLNIQDTSFYKKDLQHLANYTRSLESFSLTSTRFAKDNLYITNALGPVSQFSQLKILSLCGHIYDEDLTTIVKNCTQLEEISMDVHNSLTLNGLKVLKNAVALKSLFLNLAHYDSHDEKARLVSQFPQLKVLRLCGEVTDSSLKAIVKNCHQLEELSIDDSCSLTSNGLRKLRKATALKSLSLRLTYDWNNTKPHLSATLFAVIAQCKKMEKLFITDAGGFFNDVNLHSFPSHNNLKSLTILNNHDYYSSPIFSQETRDYLARRCPNATVSLNR